MALLSLGSVGQAVKDVQTALNGRPSSLPALIVDGIFGNKTRAKVVEFQQRNGLVADGIVGDLTLDQLLKGLFPPPQPVPAEFTGCDATKIQTITNDVARAKQILDDVNTLLPLAPFIPTTRDKVLNIFKIDLVSADNPIGGAFEQVSFFILKKNYLSLRASLDRSFPKLCESREGLFAAFVSNDFTDETMHFTPRYFTDPALDALQRAITIIHERAHTVLKLSGHPGTGDSPIGIIPHQGAPITQDQAMHNAYCYEWLAESFQKDYDPSKFGGLDVIH